MDEHFPISVQFLQNPFNRIIKEEVWFEERDAFPVPFKPYFKGSNDIPEDVPTKELRKRIALILGSKQGVEEKFMGNTHTSDLHYHEDLFDQLKQYIQTHQVDNIDSSTFSSIPTFFLKRSTFQRLLANILFPKEVGSGMEMCMIF